MDEPLFQSARLKVERANKHIIDLYELLNRFYPDYYRVVVNQDADNGAPLVLFECISNPSSEISLLSGDAVHALRSALDHLMWELVNMCGGTPARPRQVAFPMSESRKELILSFEKREIQVIGETMIDFIVDEIQPYKGGNDSLYSLSELDNFDKHRLLIPIISHTNFTGLPVGISADGVRHGIIIRKGDEVIQVVIGDEPLKDNKDVEFSSHVAFGKGQPFEDEPILPTLHSLSQIVSGIIDDIERAYLART